MSLPSCTSSFRFPCKRISTGCFDAPCAELRSIDDFLRFGRLFTSPSGARFSSTFHFYYARIHNCSHSVTAKQQISLPIQREIPVISGQYRGEINTLFARLQNRTAHHAVKHECPKAVRETGGTVSMWRNYVQVVKYFSKPVLQICNY